ncbi:hypothetical protein OPV22_003600 [Ensete ventricosum]|uniref:Serine-threonine/tyrosine-protein kinase catalytic domain-containing protein n=1 Tax=Ensete ventricosum TaxID=4639 RepID=A0AAV8S175_ENSVE|nr:hypothetical protein OPV22_003600 [Ensete ventricosum]
MMVLELVSGKRNSSHSTGDPGAAFYPYWAAKQITEENTLSLLDPRLEEAPPDEEEVTRVCRVACWCIQDAESQRPTMGQVVQAMEGSLEVNKPPLPLGLKILMEEEGQIAYQLPSTDPSASVATYTSEESVTLQGR